MSFPVHCSLVTLPSMLGRISTDKITELFLPIDTLTYDISMSTFIPFLRYVVMCAKAVTRLRR